MWWINGTGRRNSNVEIEIKRRGKERGKEDRGGSWSLLPEGVKRSQRRN